MTESQLRQKLLRDDDQTPEEIEDFLSERASDQFDDWNDRQAEAR